MAVNILCLLLKVPWDQSVVHDCEIFKLYSFTFCSINMAGNAQYYLNVLTNGCTKINAYIQASR